MASCWAKGCLYSALKGSNYCAQHKDAEEKKAAAVATSHKLPAAVAATDNGEFEIVKLETIPAFKIQNERTYKIALAVKALQPGNALRIAVEGKKARASTAVGVLNYCKKLGVTATYRTGPDCVYIWKPEEKKTGAK